MVEGVKQIDKKEHVCPHQMAFMLDNWFRRLIQHPKKVVGEYIKPGNVVMDVGCGPGYFTIDMARMVGAGGRVIAADLQTQMLDKVRKKACRHGVLERIELHRCESDRIGWHAPVDFILGFYMIHETPSPSAFLAEMKQLLNPGGKLLLVEPKMHVSQQAFEEMVKDAEAAGFHVLEYPRGKGGRSVLLSVDPE